MTINKWCLVALTVCGCACLIVLTMFLLTARHTDLVLQNRTAVFMDSTTAVVKTLTKACPIGVSAGPDCGLLVQLNNSIVQLNNVTVQLKSVAGGVNNLMFASTQTVNSLNATVEKINRDCGDKADDACGTLADVAKTLNTFRRTAGYAEIAADHEDKNLTKLDGQEAMLFSDFHNTLGSGRDSIDSLTILLKNTNIPVVIKNVADMTTTGNHMLVTADAVEDRLCRAIC